MFRIAGMKVMPLKVISVLYISVKINDSNMVTARSFEDVATSKSASVS